MRKLVKLVIFYSLSFALLFLVATGLRFLILRVEWIRTLSLEQEPLLVEALTAARWALSLTLYGGVLLGLSYAVRKKVFAPIAIVFIIAMTLCFSYGLDQLLKNWEGAPAAKISARPLGNPGLILFNKVRPAGTTIVLLEGPSKPGGRRVVATPGRPLLYQAEIVREDATLISQPPAQFRDDCPTFLRSLAIDIRLNSVILRQHLDESLFSFLVYAGALIFFLSSLIFILKLSAWPLANLFLGCLAFRGVLSLEIFLNSSEMQVILGSFLQNHLPVSWAVPLIFCVVGLLAHLYSFLVFLAKGQFKYAG